MLVVATQHTGETVLTHGKLCLWPHTATNGRLWWLSLISGGIQTVCTSHTSSDKSSKEITRHKSFTKHFLVSFYTCSFLLPLSILGCLIPDCWHDHKTYRRFISCWESEQKKAPLSGGDIMFLIFLQYDAVAQCFSDRVIMSSCFKMFPLCTVMWGPRK